MSDEKLSALVVSNQIYEFRSEIKDFPINVVEWHNFKDRQINERVLILDLSIENKFSDPLTVEEWDTKQAFERLNELFTINNGPSEKFENEMGDQIMAIALLDDEVSISTNGTTISSHDWFKDPQSISVKRRQPEKPKIWNSTFEYYLELLGECQLEIDEDLSAPYTNSITPTDMRPLKFDNGETAALVYDFSLMNFPIILLPKPNINKKYIDSFFRSLSRIAGYYVPRYYKVDSNFDVWRKGSEPKPTGFRVVDDELEQSCVSKIERGEYSSAIHSAGRILEERVRNQTTDDISTLTSASDLMKQSFNPETGPLSIGETQAEKEGVMFLYAGMIQALRNPMSHRSPKEGGERYLDDLSREQTERVISLVDLLLTFLESKD